MATPRHTYTSLPALTTIALAVVIALTVAIFAVTFNRLNRVADAASISITGWAYAEFVRQASEVRVQLAQHAAPDDLEVALAILQSKALIASDERFTDRLDPPSHQALMTAVRDVQDLDVAALGTPPGLATLERVLDNAQVAYRGAVTVLGRQRSAIAADLRAAEWTLTVLALVLALTSIAAVRQRLRGVDLALKAEVARSREAEAARAQLEQTAAELRTAEHKLHQEHDFAMQVMGAMGEGLYVTDDRGRFEYVNPILAQTVGRDAAALIGQPVADILNIPSLDGTPAPRVTLEHALPLPGGHSIPTQLTLVARSGGGQIAVITDLTETRRAEARLRDLYDVTALPQDDLTLTVQRLLEVGQEAFSTSTGAYVQWPEGTATATAQVNVAPGTAGQMYDCAGQVRDLGVPCRNDSTMAVPVLSGGGLHGVLLFRRPPGAPPFSEVDVDFLKLLGQWVEQAVERRHAYELLHRSEERNAAVIRSSLDAIITSDDRGIITEFNPAAELIFGVAREEAVGQSMAALIIPATMQDAHDRGMARMRAGGRSRILGQRLELHARRGDGEVFPVELSVVQLPTEPPVYAGFIRDITQRRAAEARLRERTTQLDSVFTVSPDGFVTFDAAGRVVDVNPAFFALTGTTPTDVLGLDVPAFERLLRQRSEAVPGVSGLADLRDIVQLGGPERRVLKRATRPMLAANGDLLGQVMYFRDITHEALVSAMKSEFMSTAAHELRTPMTSIYGFTELLLTRDLDEATTRDLLETIYRQAGRLIGLLGELLDLARIEARAGKDFDITAQPLSPLINGAADAFTPVGQRHRLHVLVPADLPPVPLDPAKFHQALGNLISNAFKYTPRGGTILIRAAHDPHLPGQVQVTVEDHGIGMTPDQSRRAFERFYRADDSGNIPGTGLGLSLVQEIMHCHGGQATLRSAPGQGTTVTLAFPLVSPVAPESTHDEPAYFQANSDR
ncbi:PAS domain S-box protein [Deinococcus yunweiensis]|uniref:PAS domain S-box protein n=1 Tax=Deinococcus yunweiensis TaxID=367282 RepID=UPI00398F1BBC